MKFSLVEGRRLEAQPGLSGNCPCCGSHMVAKCGERRVWHWAHREVLRCDHWKENETEWHRNWKNKFPAEWQEIISRAENGERHIADVKTTCGRVIEFQHSYLEPKERRSREAFYGSMFWVVDGLRRQRDKSSFFTTLLGRHFVSQEWLRYLVPSNRCPLLRDWSDSRVGVFFDFGISQEDVDRFNVPVVWHLSPKKPDGHALLTPFPVKNFIAALRNGVPFTGIRAKVTTRTINVPIRLPYWPSGRPPRGSWPHYQAQQRRARTLPRF